MKLKNSIIDYLNKQKLLNLHPHLPWLEKEIQHLWHVGYGQAQTLWCMLGLGLWMILTTTVWVGGRLEEMQLYQKSSTEVRRHVVQESLQVGSQRMFGEPVAVATQTTWKVQGIIYDDTPEKREVLLKNNRGMVQGFHQGETLPGGGHVDSITPDSVEIEENGGHFKLKMQEYPASFISDKPASSNQKGLDLKE